MCKFHVIGLEIYVQVDTQINGLGRFAYVGQCLQNRQGQITILLISEPSHSYCKIFYVWNTVDVELKHADSENRLIKRLTITIYINKSQCKIYVFYRNS